MGVRISISLWNARNKISSETLGTFKKMQVSSNMELSPADCQRPKDVPLHWLGGAAKAHSWLYFQSKPSAKAACREDSSANQRAGAEPDVREPLGLDAETLHGWCLAVKLLRLQDLRETSNKELVRTQFHFQWIWCKNIFFIAHIYLQKLGAAENTCKLCSRKCVKGLALNINNKWKAYTFFGNCLI